MCGKQQPDRGGVGRPSTGQTAKSFESGMTGKAVFQHQAEVHLLPWGQTIAFEIRLGFLLRLFLQGFELSSQLLSLIPQATDPLSK
jgi:hypothetical protein